MRSRHLLTLIAIGGLLVAVGAPIVVAGGARHASAAFVDATGATVGWAKLVEDGRGIVHVNVHVDGLAPGLHGIHIHAVGACSPTFAAAGPHFNPEGHQHGLENPRRRARRRPPESHGQRERRRPPRRHHGSRHAEPGRRLAVRCERKRVHHPRQYRRPGDRRHQRQQRRTHRVRGDQRRLTRGDVEFVIGAPIWFDANTSHATAMTQLDAAVAALWSRYCRAAGDAPSLTG